MIFTALTCDDAIEAGIIDEHNVTPLLFFFMRAWENEKIKKWICHGKKDRINEKSLLILIGWLYDNETIFRADCYCKSIADFLVRMDVFPNIRKSKTIRTYFGYGMPNEVQREAHSIISDIFEKIHRKMPK